MGGITTHVLDTTHGRPAAGMHVVLEQMDGRDRWDPVGRGVTDADGRVRTLMAESVTPAPGIYRLVFDSRGYFDRQGVRTFYPAITVTFEVAAGGASHYHVPLLLSPFGYSTYRGS